MSQRERLGACFLFAVDAPNNSLDWTGRSGRKAYRESLEIHLPDNDETRRITADTYAMSGGPILNSNGQLCGIICAALQTDVQGPYTSYGAMIWPALFTTVDFQGPGLECRGPYGIFELSNVGYLHLRDWPAFRQQISVERDENGNERPRFHPPGT